ncbi:MAG: SRPBCC family protein [Polyangiales bacterium]
MGDTLSSMHPCKPLTLEDLDRIRDTFRFEADLDATPRQVFDVFEDPDSWPVWVRAIKRVTWTSPKPFGVGTTRDVEILGGLVTHERFFAWERDREMGFTFVGTNKPAVIGLAEHYSVEPLPGDRSRLVWRVAYEPTRLMRPLSPCTRPLVRLLGARIMKGLERYVRTLPATGSSELVRLEHAIDGRVAP